MPVKGKNKLPESYEARQAATEARVESLTGDVSQLALSIDKLARTVGDGFSNLHDRITAQSRTNWPTIFGALAFLGALYAVYLQGPINTLSRLEERSAENTRHHAESEYYRGRADESRDVLKSEMVGLRATVKELESKKP